MKIEPLEPNKKCETIKRKITTISSVLVATSAISLVVGNSILKVAIKKTIELTNKK